MNRKTFAVALLVLTAALPMQVNPSSLASLNMGSKLGHWLAAQGNEALRDMRKDFSRDLQQRLKPLLPRPSETTELKPEPSDGST